MHKNRIKKWLHVSLLLLAMVVVPVKAADAPSPQRVEAARETGVWQLEEGEALLDIAQALFPQRPELQNRFIKDVTGLNFDIFGAPGQSRFKPGVHIRLPDYALSEKGRKRRAEMAAKKSRKKPEPEKKKTAEEKGRKKAGTSQPLKKNLSREHVQGKKKEAAKNSGSKKIKSAQRKAESVISERILLAKKTGRILVVSGENMFTLAKLFFPQRPRAQQIFIQDVIQLNPDVFSQAEINAIPAGTVLALPSYVWGENGKQPLTEDKKNRELLPEHFSQSLDDQQPAPSGEKKQEKMATPEVYVDQYMTESELLSFDEDDEENQPPGRRLLEAEYQYYLNRDDFLGDETEQGLHARYRRETLDYGELDFEVSLSDFTQDDNTRNHEGSDALVTIRQTGMPISNDFRLNNALGHQRTPVDPFLHGGYRFRLPTSPLLGYSAELFSSQQKMQWFAGVTGDFEGVALQQFDDDSGTLLGASWQQELKSSWTLGGQVTNLQGHDEVADHTSVLLAGKYAPAGERQSHELHLLADDNSHVGVWSDSKQRLAAGMVFRYGGFYIEPDLLWTDADIADDQVGLYLRLDKQGFRNNFSVGYDYFETGIENDAPVQSSNHAVYFNNNFRVNRRLTLGAAASVTRREFVATENDQQDSWRVNGFVYYRFPLGTSRFEIAAGELDSRNPANSRSNHALRWSHDWKTPQHFRLTTELSAENEQLFEDELQQYTASLIYRQEFMDNLFWGGNLSVIHSNSDQLGAQDGASVGLDARWQMTPHWYTSLSLNYNETTTDAGTSDFFNTDNNVKTDGVWLTVGYARTSGRPYPNFGVRNGSAGTGGITGVVFFDENRDGIRQVGEKLVQGVVILLDGRYETRTDNRGRFEYRPVPTGSHHVRLAVEDLPLPWGLDDESPVQVEVRVRQTAEVNFPLVRLDQ